MYIYIMFVPLFVPHVWPFIGWQMQKDQFFCDWISLISCWEPARVSLFDGIFSQLINIDIIPSYHHSGDGEISFQWFILYIAFFVPWKCPVRQWETSGLSWFEVDWPKWRFSLQGIATKCSQQRIVIFDPCSIYPSNGNPRFSIMC